MLQSSATDVDLTCARISRRDYKFIVCCCYCHHHDYQLSLFDFIIAPTVYGVLLYWFNIKGDGDACKRHAYCLQY